MHNVNPELTIIRIPEQTTSIFTFIHTSTALNNALKTK